VDLRPGRGGLVALEFLLPERWLALAAKRPALRVPRDTPALIATLASTGDFPADEAARLHAAHEVLLLRALDCTLDLRPRLCPPDDLLDAARADIAAACVAHGLAFSAD